MTELYLYYIKNNSMKNLPAPIYFDNIETMNRIYTLLESQIVSICERNNEVSLIGNIKMVKDERINRIEIVSVGTYIYGSKQERVINEIIDRFDGIFGGPI